MAVSSARAREQAKQGNTVGVIRVPQNKDLFTVKKAGLLQMVILPFTVSPGSKNKLAKPGEQTWTREYYVHRNFGPSGKDYAICPARTSGQRCPICEALRDTDLDPAVAKKMKPSQRSLFNVWLPKEDKVVLFDTSYFAFTEPLITSVDAKVQIPGMEHVDFFADPVEGSVLFVNFTEESLPGGKFYKAASIDFVRHQQPVPQEILAQAIDLEEALATASYSELYERFHGEVSDVVDVVPAQETKVVINTAPETKAPEAAPAPKQEKAPEPAPASTGTVVGKGTVMYHPVHGKVTYIKGADGSATVLTATDDPVKVKQSDLASQPWPDSNRDSASEPVASTVASGGDDAWDSGWSDT